MTDTQPRYDCVVVERVDGSIQAYAYYDADTARAVYEDARAEWNAARPLVFYRPRRAHGSSSDIHSANDVATIKLATRDALRARAVEYVEAVTFG